MAAKCSGLAFRTRPRAIAARVVAGRARQIRGPCPHGWGERDSSRELAGLSPPPGSRPGKVRQRPLTRAPAIRILRGRGSDRRRPAPHLRPANRRAPPHPVEPAHPRPGPPGPGRPSRRPTTRPSIEPATVQRRVSDSGPVMIAGQYVLVGRRAAGRTITAHAADPHDHHRSRRRRTTPRPRPDHQPARHEDQGLPAPQGRFSFLALPSGIRWDRNVMHQLGLDTSSAGASARQRSRTGLHRVDLYRCHREPFAPPWPRHREPDRESHSVRAPLPPAGPEVIEMDLVLVERAVVLFAAKVEGKTPVPKSIRDRPAAATPRELGRCGSPTWRPGLW